MGKMTNVIELARKAADLGDQDSACRAYELVINGEASTPAEKLEAAVYIFQSGGDYRVSYTCFLALYNAGHFQEDILSLMTAAFYAPNEEELRERYRLNRGALEKYPYLFRRDFPAFEDLPIRFFPYDDDGYIPFHQDTMRFGDYVNFNHLVVSRNFFKDLDKPILAEDVFSQYELEYLNDNVRKSEYVGRENHVYLHYTDWTVFCAYLQVLDLRPLLKEEKLVFLIGDEIGQYPIDFKERFGLDYSQYSVRPLGLREINRLIWHTQLSTHNGGDFFNEIFDAHPNLLAFTSVLFDEVEEDIVAMRKALDRAKHSEEDRRTFARKYGGRVLQELCTLRKPTDKDFFVALYLGREDVTRPLDPTARIVPAVFFQPHFHTIFYDLKVDEKDRAVLLSGQYDKICASSIFRGFPYIKTFTPMRRFTTSHGGTVRFSSIVARRSVRDHRAGKITDKEIIVMGDEVSQRVLNRSFMIDREDRLYKDAVLVRFEDGKLNPKATFTALAAFLDLPYTESMTYCSEMGRPDPHPETKGFDPAPIYKTYDDFVNDSERKYIEYFLRDAYEFYGYDFHYYDGQPVTMEQVKEWLDDFTTIDRYIRETWEAACEESLSNVGNPEELKDELLRQVRQSVEEKIEEFHRDRERISELLMRGLRFVNRGGQPLHMTPKLELDPALLEQPLYH